jgi:hypothetical protein
MIRPQATYSTDDEVGGSENAPGTINDLAPVPVPAKPLVPLKQLKWDKSALWSLDAPMPTNRSA